MPSASHVQQGAAALLPALSPNAQHTPALRSGDVCVGCIVWMPPRNSHDDPVFCNRHDCCGHSALEDAGYNHPVVVLKIRQRQTSRLLGDLICTVACATTFSDTPLPLYIERQRRRPHYRASIPILDSTSTTFTVLGVMKTLVLEKSGLKKQSYVRLQHTYEVPVSMLTQYSKRRCRAYKIRLLKASYTMLMEEMGLVPEFFEETDTLFETRDRRLVTLANTSRHSQNTARPQNVAENPQRIVFPQIYQQSPIYMPPSTIPAPQYGGTSFTRAPQYLPPSSQYTAPYSRSAEPSEEGAGISLFKCIIGVVLVSSLVWWRYSR